MSEQQADGGQRLAATPYPLADGYSLFANRLLLADMLFAAR